MRVTIQFLPQKIKNATHNIFLTERHFTISEIQKRWKGIRTEFPYNQLREIQKGWLINKILEFVEHNIFFAKYITPSTYREKSSSHYT